MGLFSKFKKGLSKGSALLQGAFDRVSGRSSLSEEDFLDLEEVFYACDFGPETTEEILSSIQTAFKKDKEFKGDDARKVARAVLAKVLEHSEGRLSEASSSKPEVICLIGVNGSGKTTTCAKLGNRFSEAGKSLTLGACDTFRAAATEQLKSWANRLDLEKGRDYLLLDTAGRLHVKDHLMEELAKLRRVLQNRDPECPQHSWLVVDGSTGTNGLSQAKLFHEKFGLTGLVVTKLDGTSKGGALVSIYRELKIPVFFLGLGEQPDDLQPFSIDAYLDSLLPNLVESVER